MDLSRSKSSRPVWVLISAGFHEGGGQSRANAALAKYLLARHTPVHLVGHQIDPEISGDPNVTVHRVRRPAGYDLLGNLILHRVGWDIARKVSTDDSGVRVLVNGGNCGWSDINWVHYLHSAWRQPTMTGPWKFRIKNRLAGWLYRKWERDSLRAARLVVVNSERTRQDVSRYLGVDPQRVHYIQLGSDPTWTWPTPNERIAARSWLKVPQESPLAVFVGGFGHDRRKGFDLLWCAWQRLCADPSWDVDLVAAGGGSAMSMWQHHIQTSGLASRVRLLGFTDRVFELLAAADLLISPVRYEPYGLNVQEAICRGVPALISTEAGIASEYPAELSKMILSDPTNSDELLNRLWAWRKDMPGWRKRFLPLAEKLRRNSWVDMAENIVTLAEERNPKRQNLIRWHRNR